MYTQLAAHTRHVRPSTNPAAALKNNPHPGQQARHGRRDPCSHGPSSARAGVATPVRRLHATTSLCCFTLCAALVAATLGIADGNNPIQTTWAPAVPCPGGWVYNYKEVQANTRGREANLMLASETATLDRCAYLCLGARPDCAAFSHNGVDGSNTCYLLTTAADTTVTNRVTSSWEHYALQPGGTCRNITTAATSTMPQTTLVPLCEHYVQKGHCSTFYLYVSRPFRPHRHHVAQQPLCFLCAVYMQGMCPQAGAWVYFWTVATAAADSTEYCGSAGIADG